MFVPLPKDPQAEQHFVPAGMEAYLLCKGAQNPEGVMRFMECILAANADPSTQEIGLQKRKDDYGWSDEMIEMHTKVTEMCRENPVYDLTSGVPADFSAILDSGEYGVRAAFAGLEWATVRESLIDVANTYIDEFNATAEAMG